MRRLRVLLASVVLVAVVVEASRAAEGPAKPLSSGNDASSHFLRLRRDRQGEPMALETAIVSYRSPAASRSEVVVDLIAAIHVADAGYYRRLNRLFESYDVLLYELIAPPGTRIPRGGRSSHRHPISALQSRMKTILELEFQLDSIDYTKDNMVHADMSPAEFSATMKDRGESYIQMFFRMMGRAMAVQSQDNSGSSDMQILLALFARDRALRLKRIMAEQFESLGGDDMLGLGGPEGSTIITERNRKAIRVLAQQIASEKKRIGIFYGAGHMPDMERRITAEFRLESANRQWFVAWDLSTQNGKTDKEDRN